MYTLTILEVFGFVQDDESFGAQKGVLGDVGDSDNSAADGEDVEVDEGATCQSCLRRQEALLDSQRESSGRGSRCSPPPPSCPPPP